MPKPPSLREEKQRDTAARLATEELAAIVTTPKPSEGSSRS
jgi:hypothetical protein